MVQSLKRRKYLALEVEVKDRSEHRELPEYISNFWNDVCPEQASDEQLVRLEVYLRQIHKMSIQDAYKLIHSTRHVAHQYDQRINEVYQNGK
ncbi:hypothetical protein [Nostoc sp.]|uniref:hypothetical protein n=1 Tax=Nostoc sp. TaxID=1180 RepID=UPI002FF3B47E